MLESLINNDFDFEDKNSDNIKIPDNLLNFIKLHEEFNKYVEVLYLILDDGRSKIK